MTSIFWPEFGILFAAALVGSLAVMPYTLKLLKRSNQDKPLRTSLPILVLLTLLQTAALSALAIVIGLFAAHASGFGAPYLEAALAGSQQSGLNVTPAIAGISGSLVGLLLLLTDLLFLPHWPQALLDAARRTTARDSFLASFYGGINEEILMRLFGFSVLVWLLSFVWHTPTGSPPLAVLWLVNIVMAIVFGIGHLPALKGVLDNMPPLMVARTLLLNAPVGLLCGWLFWTHGIEAAIFAHFSADVVYHVFGTITLNRRYPIPQAGP
jgi:hypothetical protein